MADEPKPEAPKEAKPEAVSESKESKTSSPIKDLLPLIVVVVLMPILSFLMNQFVLIPSMKSSLEKALNTAVDASKGEHPKAGGVKEGGHGGHGENKAEGGPSKPSKTFKNIIANLAGTMQSRYIKISFTLEGKSPDFESIMTENESKIIDTTLSILSTLTIVDLDNPGIRSQLRNDLLVAYANVLEKDLISNMYFSEFVVQ